jgi:ketol-acid reductoisomerase
MSNDKNTIRYFNSTDAIPGALEGEVIAVLGYGHLGRPFAMNLRDFGVESIVIGNVMDAYAQMAREDGFRVLPIVEAAAEADIVLILLPDEVIPGVYEQDIKPNLSPGKAIVFASGYTLAYDLVQVAEEIDVIMLAPRMAGENARQRFLNDDGFYAYISVEQDYSGKSWRRLLGLAEAVGILKAGAFELDANREAYLDLLVEQTLGAALGTAIMNVFSIGEDSGIPSEALVMEMYMSEEMEMVWRSFREVGFFNASRVHGPTALYGGFIRTVALMGSELGEVFRKTMEEIVSGEFARQFQAEREAGYPMLSQAEAMTMDEHPIALAEDRIRKLLTQDKN